MTIQKASHRANDLLSLMKTLDRCRIKKGLYLLFCTAVVNQSFYLSDTNPFRGCSNYRNICAKKTKKKYNFGKVQFCLQHNLSDERAKRLTPQIQIFCVSDRDGDARI